jgi:thioesterase domain-containing protein
MTLAAWGVVTLCMHAAGLEAEVFVAQSQVRYRAPLFADLEAQARLADDADWEGFLAEFRRRGRAGIELDACVRLPDGGIAAECRARYVAVGKG